MKLKVVRLATAWVMLVGIAGCDQLNLFENNRTLFQGDWHLVEMSVRNEESYLFDKGVIYSDDLEIGSYVFESNDRVEVSLDGSTTMYTLVFPNKDTMEWYVTRETGLRKAKEWRR